MVAIPVCIPTNSIKEFLSLTLAACILFDDRYSHGYGMISCNFDLHFPED